MCQEKNSVPKKLHFALTCLWENAYKTDYSFLSEIAFFFSTFCKGQIFFIIVLKLSVLFPDCPQLPCPPLTVSVTILSLGDLLFTEGN